MYKVYQRTLIVDETIKQQLYQYQLQFHVEVYKYIFRFLQHRKQVPFQAMLICDAIPKASKWQVYQIAKRCYDTYKRQHVFQFERSSVWSAQDVKIKENVLYLMKNKDEYFRIPYLCVEKESYPFLQYPIKRVDIVCTRGQWLVNILVEQ